jgi:hypothetical protein
MKVQVTFEGVHEELDLRIGLSSATNSNCGMERLVYVKTNGVDWMARLYVQ